MAIPIRQQYKQSHGREQRTLERIKRFSIIASFLFLAVTTKYMIFNRHEALIQDNKRMQASLFVRLCDMYTQIAGILNIWVFKWQKKNEEEMESTMGNVVDYQKQYLQIFRLLNFGIFVCAVIRVGEQGFYQWIFQFGVIVYCILQLLLDKAMANIEERILMSETSIDKIKDDDYQ